MVYGMIVELGVWRSAWGALPGLFSNKDPPYTCQAQPTQRRETNQMFFLFSR